ncbi:uncharacterized protein LOC118757288 [Rhagoletis pomonella]|uniref:uncharacterized protein LOC118757288 n=1 Tax=Rhagoletis pomonella TaxID=28610 RepID=UPI00177DA225|nr:uncharacterized protein LOC118757288 [Rhagoletis pomonella]
MERRVIDLIGINYIEGHEAVPDNVPLEECLEKTARCRSAQALKRKRAEEESDVQKKFLEVAEKQADAMKMLAENSSRQTDVLKMLAENTARQTEATLAMAQSMTVLSEGMKACAEGFNRLASTLGNS